MAWRDELRPATFRGVAFATRGHELGGGRRLARHEYPQRDEPYLEDLGKKAREYKITGYVFGPDYMAGRDALVGALEQPGPGELVHPYFGRLSAVAGEFGLRETTEEGGHAVFTLLFTEAGQLAEPGVGIDAAAALAESQETAFDAISEEFASGFDIDGLPAWSLDSIAATVTEFLALDSFAALGEQVGALVDGVLGLLQKPLALAESIVSIIRALDDVSEVVAEPYMPIRSWRSQVLPVTTQTRGRVYQQQAAVNLLFHRAALVQQTALFDDLPTREAVDKARTALVEAFDAHDVTPGLARPSPVLARTLQAVQADALLVLRRQAAALPQVYTLELLQVTPALALSYDLYQQLRAGEIVSRNRIRHPGFVTAGAPLEVSSQ